MNDRSPYDKIGIFFYDSKITYVIYVNIESLLQSMSKIWTLANLRGSPYMLNNDIF